MPNQPRIQDSIKQPRSSAHDRVSRATSWLVRRVAAVIVAIWLGGIVVVALATPAAFRSVDQVMASPPDSAKKVLKQFGPAPVRDLLQYQVSESNRLLLGSWGIVQASLGIALFLSVLFFTSVRRTSIILSFAMMLLALLMQLVLIPRIAAVTREVRASVRISEAEALERIRLVHGGFAVFEGVVALLGAALLVLLLRTRSSPLTTRSGVLAEDAAAVD